MKSSVILTVNDDVLDIYVDTQLNRALARISELPDEQCAEVCLATFQQGQPGPSLTALIRGTRGWLTYSRLEGDAGFSSRNPTYSGPPNATIAFTLSNGQADEYPASWTYPTTTLLSAFVDFYRTRELPSGLEWFDDSAV